MYEYVGWKPVFSNGEPVEVEAECAYAYKVRSLRTGKSVVVPRAAFGKNFLKVEDNARTN